MANFSHSTVQETTTNSLSGLLAAYKSNVDLSGTASSLFSSFLDETSQALVRVEPFDPANVAPTGQSATMPTVSQAGPQATSQTDQPVSASSQETAQTSDEDENEDVQAASDQPSDQDEATPVADQAVPMAMAEPSFKNPQAEQDKEQKQEVLSEEAVSLSPTSVDAEEQETMEPVVATSSEQMAMDQDLAPEEEQPETDLTDEELTMATMAPLPFYQLHAVKIKESAEKTQNVQSDETAPVETGATDLEQLMAQVSETEPTEIVQEEQVAEPVLDADGEAFLEKLQKTVAQGETQTTGKADSGADGEQNAVAQAFKMQDQVNKAAVQATVAPLAQTTSQTTASTTESTALQETAIQSVSTVSGTQNASSVAAGMRTSGSYDLASQLSAARVTKGGSTGLPQAVEQVSVQLHKAVSSGVDEITIQLRPAELGKVEIKLEISADKSVTGTVIADNQSTLNLLQKDSASLQFALQEAGLQADPGCLQFSLSDDGSANQFAQNQDSVDSQSSLSAMGEGEDQEDSTVLSSLTESYYVTPGRVNLRV
ncbi:MAG: flagellar hook-length control protein FliK [Bdellovibrionales bacterium]